MELKKILVNYGLTEKEAKIYLACLELDSGPVQKIANKANIARTTVYEVLESLRQKQLVTTFQKKKVRHFIAQDPGFIVKNAESNAEVLREALPQFNAIYGKSRHKPTTRFYEGKQGMKIILEEILDEADQIVSFASVDDLFSSLENYSEIFVNKRIKKKIPIRILTCKDTKKARERQRLGIKQLRQIKILSGEFQHHGLVFVWKNKIAMFSFVNDYEAVVIESKELAQMQKAMFEYLWSLA